MMMKYSWKAALAALACAGLCLQPAFAGSKRAVVVSDGSIKPLPQGDTLRVNPATTGAASLNLPQGVAPTAPVNGDVWTTGSSVFARVNGVTLDLGATSDVDLSGYATSSALTSGLAGKQPLASVLTGTTASFTTAQESKLAGIASGATANSADATLLARANHTGTQAASTISDFAASVDARLSGYATTAAVAAGYQPLDGVLTATTASFTTAKDTKLSGIATGATANSSDATLLARANHTGTQAAATISDFAASVDARLAGYATTSAVAAGYQPLDADLTTFAGITPSANVQTLLGAATFSAFRSSLGLGTLATQSGTFSGTSSGTNTGDQTSVTGNAGTATALATGRTIGITGDVTWTSPSFDGSGNVSAAGTVTKINGVALAGLATGILKNTTATGVPAIAVAADFPTLNQSTTGNAATATALATGRTISITGKATAAGGSFDGTGALALNVTAVTLAAGDIPAIAESGVTNLVSDLAAKAPLASPVFTGNQFWQQAAPTAINATATLTIANLLGALIQTTSSTAVSLTLPTGTLSDAGVLSGALAVDRGFDWYTINTGSTSGAITLVAGTGHTIVGSATCAIATTCHWLTRKTAANTFVTYRL